MLLLIALAWIYVVLMVALAEGLAPGGSVLGAFVTFVGWGVLPLGLLLYILNTPARRKLRTRRESLPAQASASTQPDGSGHPTGDAIAAEREVP